MRSNNFGKFQKLGIKSATVLSLSLAMVSLPSHAESDAELQARLNASQSTGYNSTESNVPISPVSTISNAVQRGVNNTVDVAGDIVNGTVDAVDGVIDNVTENIIGGSNDVNMSQQQGVSYVSTGGYEDTPRVDGDQPVRKVRTRSKVKTTKKATKSVKRTKRATSVNRGNEMSLVENLNQAQINTGVSMRTVDASEASRVMSRVNTQSLESVKSIEDTAADAIDDVVEEAEDRIDSVEESAKEKIDEAIPDVEVPDVNLPTTPIDVSEFAPVSAVNEVRQGVENGVETKMTEASNSIESQLNSARAQSDEYVDGISQQIDAAKAMNTQAFDTELRTSVNGDTAVIAGKEASILTIEDAKAAIAAQKNNQ